MRRSRSFITKPDLVSTTLIYPVTLTTETNTTNSGMTITGDASAPLAQQTFQVQNSAGTIKWTIPVAGGPKTNGTDLRSYNTAGTAYVALNGQQNPPCLELADGASAQGPKIWSGTGEPSSAKIGTAAAGDFYFRRGYYEYPIMSGTSVSIGAASGARYHPLATAHDVAANTGAERTEVPLAIPALFRDFKLVLATAPGVGITRTQSVSKNATATALGFDIVNPATSGSDTTDVVSFSAGEGAAARSTASGTPTASLARWRVLCASANPMFLSSTVSNTVNTAARFLGLQDTSGPQTTAAAATQVIPANCTLKRMYVALDASISAGTSYTVTVYKGTLGSETSTAMAVTLDGTTTGSIETDVSITQGQGAYIQITPTNTPTARAIRVCIEYQPDTAGTHFLLCSNNVNVSNTATRFNNWYGAGAWNATETNVQALGAACDVKGLYAVVSADTGAGRTRVLTLRQNAANTTAAVTFNNSGTAKSWSGTVTLANDDLICMQHVPSGTPTAATVKYGLVLSAAPVTTQSIYVCTAGGSPGTWSLIL